MTSYQKSIRPCLNMNRTFIVIVIFFITTQIRQNQAFNMNQNLARSHVSYNQNYDKSKTSISMIPMHDPLDTISSGMSPFSNIIASVFMAMGRRSQYSTPAFESILDIPALGSTLLTDVSHIGFDFVSFLSDKTEAVRLIILLGRVFFIMSDYLPDHQIEPDELLIQMYMLYMSIDLFMQSTLPIISTLQTRLSFKDLRLYSKVFKPAGISSLQYKAMISRSLEWIRVPPHANHVLEKDDDSLYMLYQGEATTSSKARHFVDHKESPSISIRDQQRIRSFEIFGNISFARKILDATILDQDDIGALATIDCHDEDFYNTSRIMAGTDGAILVKFNAHELMKLMSADYRLFHSMKYILFHQINDKINGIPEVSEGVGLSVI